MEDVMLTAEEVADYLDCQLVLVEKRALAGMPTPYELDGDVLWSRNAIDKWCRCEAGVGFARKGRR